MQITYNAMQNHTMLAMSCNMTQRQTHHLYQKIILQSLEYAQAELASGRKSLGPINQPP